jgi:hypothetical protein
VKTKSRAQMSVSPIVDVPGFANPFKQLVKNQIRNQKRQLLVKKGEELKDLHLRDYRISILNRTLFTIAFPIFIWLILETFCR